MIVVFVVVIFIIIAVAVAYASYKHEVDKLLKDNPDISVNDIREQERKMLEGFKDVLKKKDE